MAMEFGSLSKMTLGEAATTAATEGGSVVVGLFGAGILGKQVEKYIGTTGSKNAISPTSTVSDRAIAYTLNNGTKVALWYLLKKEGTRLGSLGKDIEKGIVASVILDTVVRAGNGFRPKSLFKIANFDILGGVNTDTQSNTQQVSQLQSNIQRVVQENSTLRNQLNQALNKLASTPVHQNINVTPVQPNINVTPAQPNINITPVYAPSVSQSTNRQKRFGVMESDGERQRKFGAMESDGERQRKFGAMSNMSINNSNKTLGEMYGFD